MPAPKQYRNPDEALIADLVSIHAEYGYINQTLYALQGRYAKQALVKRFGSWEAVLQLANLQDGKAAGAKKEVKTTWCIECDGLFERPATDPSCRRCKQCRNNIYQRDLIQEGNWIYVNA